MQEEGPRPSRSGDEPGLKRLWAEVFGDTRAYIDTFFDFWYSDGEATLVERDGKAACAAHSPRVGGIRFPDGDFAPVSMIYALATDPAYRGFGYATEVVRASNHRDAREGIPYNVLCPAEDSLFGYYTRHLGYQDRFWVRESTFVPRGRTVDGTCRSGEPSEYNARRNAFLRGSLYLEFDDRAIGYQRRLCRDTGGDLVLLDFGKIQGCACCEKQEDGALFVKELLLPEELLRSGAELLAGRFDAQRLLIRTPASLGASLGGAVRRFGQIVGEHLPRDEIGYFGFAFD